MSCVSARAVLEAADPDRYQRIPVGITLDGEWRRADDVVHALTSEALLPKALEAAGTPTTPSEVLAPAESGIATVVFPVLHGPMGEDGTMQGLLELHGVPYVGAGVLGSALAMDKAAAKQMLELHGIPQTRYASFHEKHISEDLIDELTGELGLPLFVKPANMGSSIGVSKACTFDELRTAIERALLFDEWLVVEEGVDARELEVSVIGNLEPRASLPGEVVSAGEFYDYDEKYVRDSAELIIPAALPNDLVEDIKMLAIAAYRALRVEGMARVDFFLEEFDRGLLLNEVNTIPGFTPISMYPKLWEVSGVPFPALIDELVDLALTRYARRSTRRRAR